MLLRGICTELPLLRRRSLPVAKITPEVHALAHSMWDQISTRPCSGVSAIQFGHPTQVIISLVPPELLDKVYILGSHKSLVEGEEDHFGVFINPKITAVTSRDMVGIEVETCLSMPGVKCVVPRALDVKIRYQTLDSKTRGGGGKDVRFGKLSGFFARVFQHEIDHIDGILMTDRHLQRAQLEEIFQDNPQELLDIDRELLEADDGNVVAK